MIKDHFDTIVPLDETALREEGLMSLLQFSLASMQRLTKVMYKPSEKKKFEFELQAEVRVSPCANADVLVCVSLSIGHSFAQAGSH